MYLTNTASVYGIDRELFLFSAMMTSVYRYQERMYNNDASCQLKYSSWPIDKFVLVNFTKCMFTS